jgi:peptide/nickel transport system substrate-binding protein
MSLSQSGAGVVRARAHRVHARRVSGAIPLIVLVTVAAFAVACGGERDTTGGGGSAAATSDVPERGGTLRIIGNSDVDHLSTSSGYYTPSTQLFRGFTRQLVTYPIDPDYATQATVVADLATSVPTRENGGVSADGKTYTFHMRRRVKWNTQPPRDVTAPDLVRGIKMMCNPVSPFGAPGYYESTIQGLKEYCTLFAKVNGVPADIARFLDTHDMTGVRAPDDTTVVFTLVAPASDFLNILAMPFASPMPVEYLAYVPDGPEFRAHTISNGPYQITHYVPNREIEFERNPAWDRSTDPLRRAYVDRIHVIEGVSAQSVQQQLQAGTAELSWDQSPPTADLVSLLALKDPNLVIGPPGGAYALNVYLPVNFLSPNANGALRNLKVRQALEYGVDRLAVTQVYGGPAISQPLRQVVVAGSGGSREGYDPYPTPGDRGDPAKAKQLLAEAGYAKGITLKLLYRTYGKEPQAAQTVQASLEKAGFTIELVSATGADFFAKYLQNPENAKRGIWDLALAAWVPDWYGNNGRTVIEPLYDGRTYGPNSSDYGDYNSDEVNRLIDQAQSTASARDAAVFWEQAAMKIMEDAAVIPLTENKYPTYHSTATRGCIFSLLAFNCDITAVWLEGAATVTPGRGGS